MQAKVSKPELPGFDPIAEVSLQKELRVLGGREMNADESWRTDERYGVSVRGRRFVFRDAAAFYRFEEFVRTEFTVDRVPRTD